MKLFKALDIINEYTKYEMAPGDTEDPNSPENTI